MPDQHTMLKEIEEQIRVLQLWQRSNHEDIDGIASQIHDDTPVLLTGSGTSLHAAEYTSFLLKDNGMLACTFPASETSFLPENREHVNNRLLIVFSQSGGSRDALDCAKKWKDLGGKIGGVTNNQNSELYKLSDFPVDTGAGPEKALAATKSHLAQLLFGLTLRQRLKHAQYLDFVLLGNQMRKLLNGKELIQNFLRKNTKEIMVLGSGLNYIVAKEGALKIKETSSTIAEAYPTREFLHGPMQILSSRSLVLMLSPNKEVKDILEKVSVVLDVSSYLYDEFRIDPEDEYIDSICKLVFLQLFAYFRAVFLGRDPDSSTTLLTKVVK